MELSEEQKTLNLTIKADVAANYMVLAEDFADKAQKQWLMWHECSKC